MQKTILTIAALLSTITVAQAENLSHLNQLLSTKQCPQCELSGSGLVMSNLTGADLSGANLTSANLSQANLSGANLSGANLVGASLYGANLTGANLTGANLHGTDLRNAYLHNATLTGVSLETAYLQGATGIPENAATPEQFQRWGLTEAGRGNFDAAINHYNQALNINPEYAPAYLARGLAYYNLKNEAQASQDAQTAATLFEKQGHTQGYQTTQNFIQGMELARQAAEERAEAEAGGSGLGNAIKGVFPALLQLLLL